MTRTLDRAIAFNLALGMGAFRPVTSLALHVTLALNLARRALLHIAGVLLSAVALALHLVMAFGHAVLRTVVHRLRALLHALLLATRFGAGLISHAACRADAHMVPIVVSAFFAFSQKGHVEIEYMMQGFLWI